MRRTLAAAFVLAVVGASGCGTTVQPGAAPTSPRAGRPTYSPSVDAGVTLCADIAADIPPSDTEVNTVLDRERGRLEFSFLDAATNEDRSFTVAYYADPDCRAYPRLNQLIQHALDAS
jgi:hypothetical protein